MIEKTPQNEKERLRRLNLVLELDFLRKNFCWPNESQETCRLAVSLLPELNGGWPEPRPELIGLERGEFAQGVHPPLVEDGDNLRNLRGPSRDQAVSAFTNRISSSDPRAAVQWAATISNENLRENQMETTARAWLKADPRNASTWISNSTLPEDTKTRLLNPGG